MPVGYCKNLSIWHPEYDFEVVVFAFLFCLGDDLSLLVWRQNRECKQFVILGLFIHSCYPISFSSLCPSLSCFSSFLQLYNAEKRRDEQYEEKDSNKDKEMIRVEF